MLLVYLVIVLVGLILFIKWRHSLWYRLGVPYIEPELFFGNLREVMTGKRTLRDLTLDIYKQSKALGRKYVGYYRIVNPVFVPIDLSLIKRIMLKDFQHFNGHNAYHHPKDILSMHLFNIEGEYWRKLRVKYTPTFTSGKMKMMFETVMQKGEVLQNFVSKLIDRQEPLAAKKLLANYTLDVIGTCGFGIECNCIEETNNIFSKHGRSVFKVNYWNTWLRESIPNWILGPIGFKSNGRDATVFISKLVKETIEYREKNNISRKDFLNLLLELKNQKDEKGNDFLSMDEIISQCFVFFAAGFETSSTTMTFALLELAQHQEIQDKLRQEINEVIEKHNGTITYDAVMDMVYLDQVLSESLRMYPPLPLLPRTCTKRYLVPDTDIVLEKGTGVDIFIWAIHMDPEYFPNPEVFDPERFSKENVKSRPDFTYLPFGDGPRICIGSRFGLLQAKIGLISMMRNFKLTINSKTQIPVQLSGERLVHSVKDDIWLNATRI